MALPSPLKLKKDGSSSQLQHFRRGNRETTCDRDFGLRLDFSAGFLVSANGFVCVHAARVLAEEVGNLHLKI